LKRIKVDAFLLIFFSCISHSFFKQGTGRKKGLGKHKMKQNLQIKSASYEFFTNKYGKSWYRGNASRNETNEILTVCAGFYTLETDQDF